eukprot:5197760-Pyramimonas_sp.AAC.1
MCVWCGRHARTYGAVYAKYIHNSIADTMPCLSTPCDRLRGGCPRCNVYENGCWKYRPICARTVYEKPGAPTL